MISDLGIIVSIQGKNVCIRKANINDSEKIRNLVLSLSKYYFYNKDSTLPEWFLSTLEITAFECRISSDNFEDFVYLSDGLIVGYLSIKDKSHLYHMFVKESFQGKGIARLLWNHAVSFLGSPPYSVRSSIYAIPIYRQFGFVESGEPMLKDGVSFQPMLFDGNVLKNRSCCPSGFGPQSCFAFHYNRSTERGVSLI